VKDLSNKALVVLELLRESGEMTCHQVADTIRERTPCGQCGGTGEGDDSRFGCRSCYGRGQVGFFYTDAYVVLRRLVKKGLVSRRYLLDEWGDVTNKLVWSAVEEARLSDDPLEDLFRAPAAQRNA
jgi:hypothetical protein